MDNLFFNPLIRYRRRVFTSIPLIAEADAAVYWSTRSTFAYRSLPIYDAVFSPDSTILALAHGSVVTLWDVEKNVLLRALDGALKDVRQIGFVGEEGRFLVAAEATKGLAVWDLLSCEGELISQRDGTQLMFSGVVERFQRL